MKGRHLKSLKSEQGASLVLLATSMMLLLGIVAVAVDLAAIRSDLRTSRLTSDAAATAGVIQINPIDGSDAEAACETAWEYLLLNLEDEGAVGTPPTCSTFSTACDPTTARKTEPTAGPYSFVITHPVPDTHDLMTGQALNEDVDGAACQRLGVTVERTRDYLFARVMGFTAGAPVVSSVARIAVKPGEGELVPLLLLEPIACDALVASGQGAVTVDRFNDVPGIIAVDSDGSKTSNPNRCGANRYTINANDNSLNWIRALPADDIPSAILSYALSGAPGAVPAHAYDPNDVNGAIDPILGEPSQTWFRLFPEPTPTTRRITRAPIDWRYNCKTSYPPYPLDLSDMSVGITVDRCPDAPGTPSHIESLRSPGRYGGPVGTSPVGIFQRWSENPDGTPRYPCTVSGPLVVSGDWWIDCPGGFVVQDGVVTFEGSDLVFDGGVEVKSFGELHINPNPARPDPSSFGDHIVYLRDGDLTKGAQSTLVMDQTFVYLHTGRISIGGGAGADSLIWTAPLAGDFEDLALWAEAPLVFDIGGQGGNTLTGTFFTPLGDPFTLTGQGGQFQTSAQFLTRRLEVKGQGVVRMVPDPERSTEIPIRGVMLIR